MRIGTLQATKRLIDSSYEALFLSIYCLSSSKQSFVTKKKQPATDREVNQGQLDY